MKYHLLATACVVAVGFPCHAQTMQAPSSAESAVAADQDAAAADERPAPDAQTAPSEAAAPAESAGGADIIVTGSRIRGVAPVGSNLISIGADQITKEPAATVTEFLRKVPQVQGFGVDASSAVAQGVGGTNTTRGSSLNLRGLGPQATLTLLDGQRLPFSGVSSNYVDPTAIPAIALSRIEVIADGASAIYGSDAVAGVVNFITRKDYDGLLVRGRYGVADDYWLGQISVLAGKSWGTGNIMIAYEHGEHSNLNGGDRSYVRSDLRAFGGDDYRNSQCNPGNIVIGGTSYAIPDGGVTPATADQLLPGTSNACENLRYGDILPSENRDSFIVNAEQQITDNLKLSAQALYSDRDYTALALQQGSTSNLVDLTVPSSNAFFVAPPGTNPSSETIEYDFTSDFGLIRQNGYTRDRRFSATLDWTISDAWEASISGLYGVDKSAQLTRRVDGGALAAALADSDPATAFNPYGAPNTQAALDSVFVGIFNPYSTNRTRGGSGQINGRLFSLPGGDVRLALGGEFLRYTAGGGSAIGLASNPRKLFAKQTRNQTSGFGELFIPIFSADNAIGGFQRLDLSLAGRIDHYDDIGTTKNPKIGINWSPVRGLLLKGSYGTSFRAPALQDLPLLRTGAGLAVVTWLDPQSPTGNSVGLSLNAGNPDLKPEKAETYSFTAEVTPSSVPGLRLSATYFSVDYSDVINFPPRTPQSLLDPNYAFVVTRDPSDALIQSYLDKGFTIAGIRPAHVAFFYNGQARNLGSVNTDGIDFSASYDRNTDFGQLSFSAVGTYLLHYKVAISPVAPSIEQKGNINYPVDFRGRASAGWARDGLSAELTVNYVNGYDNNLVTPVQRIDSWTTFDLHLGYDFQNDGGVLKGTSISLDGTNIFDRRAPFVNIQYGFDPGEASALGRFVTLTLTKKF